MHRIWRWQVSSGSCCRLRLIVVVVILSIVMSLGQRTLLNPRLLINLTQWDIPKVNIKTIYKIGTFSFQTAFSIKNHEDIMSLQNGLQTISLIKPEAIQIHLKH